MKNLTLPHVSARYHIPRQKPSLSKEAKRLALAQLRGEDYEYKHLPDIRKQLLTLDLPRSVVLLEIMERPRDMNDREEQKTHAKKRRRKEKEHKKSWEDFCKELFKAPPDGTERMMIYKGDMYRWVQGDPDSWEWEADDGTFVPCSQPTLQ